ncbi:MAG TPA: methyltransferase domain-containing protein [Caulobacteraceae bacterium]|jgi:SAM-dependent methyltransferase
MRDLSQRSDEVELMDSAETDFETFRDCLRDLARVNVMTLGYRPTLAFLERLRRQGRLDLGRPVTIVDAGSGYGDLLRKVERWGARRRVAVRLIGVDLNPWSARAAQEATPAESAIGWVTGDAFDRTDEADIVVCALFTHHLDDERLVRFLQLIESKTRLGWFINDLHRHPVPYAVFGPLAAAMRWHRFVRHDGPLSIARAFVPADWRALIEAAGVNLDEVDISWRFPFRLCVGRIKPA